MSNLKLEQHPRSFLSFFQKLIVAHWQILLLLLLGVGLPLLVFGQLAIVVYQNGGFTWDVAILEAIHSAKQPILDRIATTLTPFGVYRGVFPATIALSIGLFYQRKWRSLTYFLITLIGSMFLNRAAKVLFHRVRPDLWQSVVPEFDFSFPSGHAMASMSLAIALIVLTWGTRWIWITAFLSVGFAVSIAWTRLYLGVHFPSDILAGWMVSFAWAIGVSLVVRPYLSQMPQTQTKETSLSTGEAQFLNELSTTEGR